MVHFFSILDPARHDAARQKKPFFTDDLPLSPAELDAAILSGKLPPQPDPQLADRDESYRHTRFVSLLSPPFF